jgi:predicted unusual protein kinase regulating ubiquinone biosynthesis (AarF/ABC1/UbiB family)
MVASLTGEDVTVDSQRLQRARMRLAEAQGIIPIGASENPLSVSLRDYKSIPSQSKVREISWRVAEPAVKYDSDLLAERFFAQPFKWLERNAQFLVPMTFFTLRLLIDIITKKEFTNRKKRADEILNIISAQSPALIKAGQALASRPDLLPKEYLDSLQKLQDRCPAYPTAQAISLFEQELGQSFDDVFELDTETSQPIAAASIGQVYKGTLKSNGAKVAIKIQRPYCEESIAVDMFIMRWYASLTQKALEALGRSIDLVSVIDDFGDLIYREIDYRAEAVNAQRFAELYASIPDVFVPKVYTDLSTSKVSSATNSYTRLNSSWCVATAQPV